MRRVCIYGRELELQGSPYTLLLYKEAFGGSLFSGVREAFPDGEAPDVEALLKVVWALNKTRDDDAPEYAEWLGEFDADAFALNDLSWLGEVDSAISAELFRQDAPHDRPANFRRRIRATWAGIAGLLHRA